MDVFEGYEIAAKIIKKCDGCHGALEYAQALGIEVIDDYDLHNLKGMYSSADRFRTIYLNRRLCGAEKEIVTFHEIGHDQIPEHRLLARRAPLREVQLFPGSISNSQRELEANVIAAHLYIKEDELLSLLKEQYTVEKCGQILQVPLDLLQIKLHEMVKAGSIPAALSDYGDSFFLKHIGFGRDVYAE